MPSTSSPMRRPSLRAVGSGVLVARGILPTPVLSSMVGSHLQVLSVFDAQNEQNKTVVLNGMKKLYNMYSINHGDVS